jgi:hypothetical protein
MPVAERGPACYLQDVVIATAGSYPQTDAFLSTQIPTNANTIIFRSQAGQLAFGSQATRMVIATAGSYLQASAFRSAQIPTNSNQKRN